MDDWCWRPRRAWCRWGRGRGRSGRGEGFKSYPNPGPYVEDDNIRCTPSCPLKTKGDHEESGTVKRRLELEGEGDSPTPFGTLLLTCNTDGGGMYTMQTEEE